MDDRPLRRAVKRLFPARARTTLAVAITDAVRVLPARRARRLAQTWQPVLVQLGSGRTPKPGWINIDLAGKGADVSWNLLRPLPFDDGTIDAVFHEHVLEHFALGDAYSLTRDVFRVLRPAGVLRVAVPDAGRYARSYAATGEDLDRLRPNRPTRMLALQEVFLRFGHRSAYDSDTLRLLLSAAGFTNIQERSFGDTDIPGAPDSEHRRLESLYVEAKKPDEFARGS
jgi:predicted SAM-dependent methyltransferase